MAETRFELGTSQLTHYPIAVKSHGWWLHCKSVCQGVTVCCEQLCFYCTWTFANAFSLLNWQVFIFHLSLNLSYPWFIMLRPPMGEQRQWNAIFLIRLCFTPTVHWHIAHSPCLVSTLSSFQKLPRVDTMGSSGCAALLEIWVSFWMMNILKEQALDSSKNLAAHSAEQQRSTMFSFVHMYLRGEAIAQW